MGGSPFSCSHITIDFRYIFIAADDTMLQAKFPSDQKNFFFQYCLKGRLCIFAIDRKLFHKVSKAFVTNHPKHTLFVLEGLSCQVFVMLQSVLE